MKTGVRSSLVFRFQTEIGLETKLLEFGCISDAAFWMEGLNVLNVRSLGSSVQCSKSPNCASCGLQVIIGLATIH